MDPSTAGLRIIAPAEYQGWNDSDPCRQGSGLPFGGTGPSTQGCDVYAGHWLYAPGSTLRSAINAGTTTVQVADASRFNAGRYVVIYEGGAGAFRNAEHARVTGVNRSNNTLTLANRGYKSTAASHPAGSIIAEHVIGNGGEQDRPELDVQHEHLVPAGRQRTSVQRRPGRLARHQLQPRRDWAT